MNLVDLTIILLLILGFYHWYRVGFVQGGFSIAGIILGIFVGTLVAPWTMGLVSNPIEKFIILIVTIGVLTAVLATIGEVIGHNIHIRLNNPNLKKANYIAGGIFSVFFILTLSWLLAAAISSSPYKALNKQIQNSLIVQTLNDKFPSAPSVVGRISSLIAPLDFPKVFVGTPPKLSAPVSTANSEFVKNAVTNAGLSTVRIESEGCNSISTGSGFIAQSGYVLTNAHVVAGGEDIEVVDTYGKYKASVVYFDPLKDIAIIKTPALKAPVLKISDSTYPRGQEIAVFGFPGGGDFVAVGGGITREIKARGFDIYNQNQVVRNIYEFQGKVVKGDSGGPVVLEDGTVIGMVFASAQNNEGFGYALTSPEILDAISRVNPYPVGTGQCIAQ